MCLVLTVPDSAGEGAGAAGAPAAGGSLGLPVPAFLEAHTGSFRLACRGQISCLAGAASASAMGPAENKKAKPSLGNPWKGQEGHRLPSAMVLRQETCL